MEIINGFTTVIPVRGNPWWVFVIHNKKRTSKLVGDKKAAERVASEIRARLNLNQYEFDGKKPMPLFKDFAEGYLETYSAMNHKPSTQGSYRIALEKHIYPYFGNMPIDQIKRPLIKKFIQDPELNKKLSAATIRNLKAYISSILSEAVEDELIEANPAAFTGKLIKKNRPGKKD